VIPTITTYRKVGVFLYCVQWRFIASCGDCAVVGGSD